MAVQHVTRAPGGSDAGTSRADASGTRAAGAGRSAAGASAAPSAGRRPGRLGRVRPGAVAAALAVLALAGCSAESGAAAVVDGRVIPVADVHTATAELRPYLDEPSPASILAVLVAEPTMARVAGEHGVAVSPQQVRDLLAQASSAPAAEGLRAAAPPPEGGFSDPSVTVARFTLLQNGLRGLPDAQGVQADLLAELDRLDVDVNPRFGEIDFTTGGLAPVEHPWLVPSAEAAAP